MYKKSSKFQLSQPANQFFTDHFGFRIDQEVDQTGLQPNRSPLYRLRAATRRIGVEYYLRNKVSHLEIVALLLQLIELECILEMDVLLFGELDQRIAKLGDVFCFSNDEIDKVIKLICNGLSILDTRPSRHPIVNWSANPI
jgi:hypothetical protein